jgi:3-keto-disaccharide hydrolase
MRVVLRAGLLASLLVTTVAAPRSSAREPVKLFNGMDLSGWAWVSAKRGSRIEDIWTVVDGNLRCNGTVPGYIRTDSEYTSFILTMQVRRLTEGDGGVLLRVIGGEKVWPKSIGAETGSDAFGDIWNLDQFPMEVDPRRTQGAYTKRIRADLAEKPLGEWNDYEIRMNGGELTLRVNGVVQNVAWGCRVLPGKIALRSHGGMYELRKILLRPLPDEGFRGLFAE